MPRLLFAAAMLTSTVGYVVNAKAEQPVMAYPQMYKFMTDTASSANSRTYLHCDDATDECERARERRQARGHRRRCSMGAS